MLWLCIRLPHLPLEALHRVSCEPEPGAEADPEIPLIICAAGDRRQRVLACNVVAESRGIAVGMTAGECRALTPSLRVLNRQRQAEQRCLNHLAAWALQFTPVVCRETPDRLLLEIRGSLNLFDGLEALLTRIISELCDDGLGFRPMIAVAPTPLAATLLATPLHRSGIPGLRTVSGTAVPRVLHCADLPDAVAALNLAEALRNSALPARIADSLQNAGIHRIGDCLALPRAGLARRYGPKFTAWFDRLLGDAPDPRRPFKPPKAFDCRRELAADIEQLSAIRFPLQRMLQELCAVLRGCDRAVRDLQVHLSHASPMGDSIDDSIIRLRLSRPTRDPVRLLGITTERITRSALPAPVRSLRLTADHFVEPVMPQLDLFDARQKGDESWHELHDNLVARLGNEALESLALNADHRPERAWRRVERPSTTTPPQLPPRPAWLLNPPEALPDRLLKDDALKLLDGPERLESGWWDGHDARRDYYVVRTARGQRLWIFRTAANQWFVHGLFA